MAVNQGLEQQMDADVEAHAAEGWHVPVPADVQDPAAAMQSMMQVMMQQMMAQMNGKK